MLMYRDSVEVQRLVTLYVFDSIKTRDVIYFRFYYIFDIICNIAIYADDTTLYSKCDQASDLWQQLELASELQSDLQDTGLG